MACLVFLLWAAVGQPARAAAPAPAHPAATANQALTPLQAQQALAVLNDPARRDEIVRTLQAIARAAPAPAVARGAPAASAGKTAASAAKPTVTLVRGSLGAELVTGIGASVAVLGRDLGHFATGYSALLQAGHWLYALAALPSMRAQASATLWRLAVVALVALAAERLLGFALRRPTLALARLSPPRGPGAAVPAADAADDDAPAPTTPADADLPLEADPPPEPEGPPEPDGIAAPLPPARPKPRPWRALRRLPYGLARLVLDVLPPLLFLLVANVLLGTPLGRDDLARGVVTTVVDDYVTLRIVLAVSRMFTSPALPTLRLLHLPDAAAAYAYRWARGLAVGVLGGFALTQSALLLGLEYNAFLALQRIIALGLHVAVVVLILQLRGPVARRLQPRKRKHGVLAILLRRFAAIWHWIAIFYVMALWLVWAAELQNGYARLGHFFVVTASILVLARLAGIVLLGGLERGLHLEPEVAARYPWFQHRAPLYYPVLRAILIGALAGATLVALLEGWGFDLLGGLAVDRLGGRVVSALATMLVACLVAIVAWEGLNAALNGHIARLTREAATARAVRLQTLLPILRTTLLVAILTVLGLTVLSEIGVNIAPLLAGAGIFGVALGFGSQKLVQDFITGIFLLVENAMQVGDVVTAGGFTGSVENLSIRTLRLRDGDGSVHIIPFSSVSVVTNTNRDFANAAVAVSVGYKEDTDRVSEALARIVAEMREHPDFRDRILGDFALWGVDQLGDFSVTIKGQVRTLANARWPVQREIIRRIKKRFEELGIELPYPTRTLVLQTAPGAEPWFHLDGRAPISAETPASNADPEESKPE